MAKGQKVIITCAVTGSIHTPSMSPHLPVTASEIADAVCLREIRVTPEEDARRVAPVLGEGGLEQVDHGAFEPQVRLSPVSRLPAVAFPPAADPGPARETHPSVDDQDSAVIAVIDALDRERVQRMKPRELTACVPHGGSVLLGHVARADRIEEDVHAHSGPAALGQR